jgi:hypothetical protein
LGCSVNRNQKRIKRNRTPYGEAFWRRDRGFFSKADMALVDTSILIAYLRQVNRKPECLFMAGEACATRLSAVNAGPIKDGWE